MPTWVGPGGLYNYKVSTGSKKMLSKVLTFKYCVFFGKNCHKMSICPQHMGGSRWSVQVGSTGSWEELLSKQFGESSQPIFPPCIHTQPFKRQIQIQTNTNTNMYKQLHVGNEILSNEERVHALLQAASPSIHIPHLKNCSPAQTNNSC